MEKVKQKCESQLKICKKSRDRNAVPWQNLKKEPMLNKVDHPFLSTVFPWKG